MIGLSFVASAIAAAIGLGGGILMLAAMASLLPAAAIVPVHAIVQWGSNAGRAWMMAAHVQWRHAWPFFFGTLLGVALGSQIYAALPADLIRLILGLFILQTVWLPLPFLKSIGQTGVALGGGIAAFLTMFIGATGPFLAAIWQALGLKKSAKVATHAAAMTLQHGVKIIAFGVLGFAFAPWLVWTGLLIAAGLGGTYYGARILQATPDQRFEKVFKGVLTALALLILWQALRSILSISAN